MQCVLLDIRQDVINPSAWLAPVGSKIGVTSSFACLPIAQVNTLITDNSANANHLEAIRAAGIQVLLCPQVE